MDKNPSCNSDALPKVDHNLSDLTKGIRSVVDAKGNFVTSRKAESEEYEIKLEGPRECLDSLPIFDEFDDICSAGVDEDSDDDEEADDVEYDVDFFETKFCRSSESLSQMFLN